MLFILAWLFWLYRNQRKDDDDDNGWWDGRLIQLEEGVNFDAYETGKEMHQPMLTLEDEILPKVNGILMSDNSAQYRHCYGSALPIISNSTNGYDKLRESSQPIIEKPFESALRGNGLERTNDFAFPDNNLLLSTDFSKRNLVQDEPIIPQIRSTSYENAPAFMFGKHFDEHEGANDGVDNTTLTVTTQTHVNSNLSISLTQPHRHTQLSVNVVDTMVTSPSSSPSRKHYKSEIKLIPSPTFRRKSINFTAEDEEIASILRPSDEVTESDMRYTTRHGVNVSVEAEPIGRIHSIVVRPEGRSPIRSLHQESDDEDYDENQVRLVVEKKKPSGKIQAINVSTGHHDDDYIEVVEDEICASEEEFDNAIPEFSDNEYFSDDVIEDVENSNDFGNESDVSIEEKSSNKNPFAQYVEKEESEEEIFDEVVDEQRPATPVPQREKTTSSEDDSVQKGKPKSESKLFNKLKSLQKPKESESSEDTEKKPLVTNVKTVKKSDEPANLKKEEVTRAKASEPVKTSQTNVTKPSAKEAEVQKPKESSVKPRPKKPSFTVEQKSDSDDFMSIMKRRKKYVDTMDDAGRLLGQIANRDAKVLGRPAVSKNWKILKECVRTKRYLLFKDKPMRLAEPYRQSGPASSKNLYGKYRI